MKKEKRKQTVKEEVANSLTHGAGLIAGIIAFLAFSNWEGSESEFLGLVVYGSTLFLLYLASTLYHAFQCSKWKSAFRVLDHSAIYLFIAGCYTPVMLRIGTQSALIVLVTVWSTALLGVYMTSLHFEKTKTFCLILYLVMGWLAIVMIKPIIAVMSVTGLVCFFAGGISYTVGVIFYLKDSILFFHTIWHLFVLAGSGCHFHMIIFG